MLADVSESFPADRGAIMGLYSVFLALGQIGGSLLGGFAAEVRGIDGILVATLVPAGDRPGAAAPAAPGRASDRRPGRRDGRPGLRLGWFGGPPTGFRRLVAGPYHPRHAAWETAREPCRRRHRLRRRSRSGPGGCPRDRRRPAHRELRLGQLPGWGRDDQRGLLDADDGAGRPVPQDGRVEPGVFKEAFEASFAAGADAIVCVTVGAALSGTNKSATLVARGRCPTARSTSSIRAHASMGRGDPGDAGHRARGHGRARRRRSPGRSRSGPTTSRPWSSSTPWSTCARAAGSAGRRRPSGPSCRSSRSSSSRTVSSPPLDRVRTRSKARARAVEHLTQRPVERMAILHTVSPDVESFRDELLAHVTGDLDPSGVSIELVGASVGPHLGPGAVGASVLRRRTGLAMTRLAYGRSCNPSAT